MEKEKCFFRYNQLKCGGSDLARYSVLVDVHYLDKFLSEMLRELLCLLSYSGTFKELDSK